MQSAGWNKQNITENMENVSENNSEMISMDERLLERLKTCVLDNLENENFGVEDLADEVAFSRSHFVSQDSKPDWTINKCFYKERKIGAGS